MAHHATHGQNKGTLVPGQSITVNNYVVQVERYLSQGGFAHVYLVRTPTPVYNTTHHVLKRIAVGNEVMLTEVKKEVDVMRLLKGHPNIVHLIDAAWHKLSNGTFEVFILMEYCPGGGIIDMMNRRLRERLTEAEILQIFVDVCEGVGYMHNSRPPLLHRDLKVENILQSSPTSFKLCDFGSATTVSSPPSNMQEIRALEADLNRHTTLQYRAPEMVDVYSKRPVNEKSDVWALGVLLYKLCYYTTPFEEHGPLAILNVQYRIPPYPVYSQDMNMLIASMLREHGAQRPSVFELLNHVHRLRGTKSKFNYTIPVPPPLAPPRPSQPINKQTTLSKPGEGVVTYGAPAKQPMSLYGASVVGAMPTQGVQAREKVLEAIAPMRRGRPKETHTSRPASPHKATHPEAIKSWPDVGFDGEQDRAWQSATQKSSAPSKVKEDAWSLIDTSTVPTPPSKSEKPRSAGFGDDFSQDIWKALDSNGITALKPVASPQPQTIPVSAPAKPGEASSVPATLAFTGSRMLRPKQDRVIPGNKEKDAFEGLGLMTNYYKPPPTLGEARKLRTGLAIMGSSMQQGDYLRPKVGESSAVSSPPRPSPSPQPNYLASAPIQAKSLSPLPTPNNSASGKPGPHLPSANASLSQLDGFPIESRFPSLEELDARYVPSSLYSSALPSYSSQASSKPLDSRPSQFTPRSNQLGSSLKPSTNPGIPHLLDGTRSEQVTGTAMRETKESKQAESRILEPKSFSLDRSSTQVLLPTARRPSLVRKHRSSVAMQSYAESTTISDKLADHLDTPKLPPRPGSRSPMQSQSDWLTGEDHPTTQTSTEVPILRESPSKRASYIPQSEFTLPLASSVQHVFAPQKLVNESEADLSPTVSKFKKSFPDVEKLDTQHANAVVLSGLSDNWSPVRQNGDPDTSSGEEGPEDPSASGSRAKKTKNSGKHKARQSSVHDLVNQYGGTHTPKESERPHVSHTARIGLSDYVPRKAQPTGGVLSPPANRLDLDRKTPSPTIYTHKANSTSISASPSKASYLQQPQGIAQSQASSSKPSPAGARSRPQSMFIFPSRATEPPTSSTPTTANAIITNLAPPEDAKAARATRRTSISDMVQKYEAIGGVRTPTLPPGPPSPVHRPIPIKGGISTENGRRALPDASKPIAERLGSPVKSRTLDNHNLGLGASPSGKAANRNRIVSDNQKPSTSEHTARIRKLSVKNEPTLITSTNRTDPLPVVRTAKLSQEPASTHQLSRSPRKTTTSLTPNDDVPRTPIEPDRPYQGVGKLIDQWQKKSAEAEQSRPTPAAKRSFTPKRVGTIPGDG